MRILAYSLTLGLLLGPIAHATETLPVSIYSRTAKGYKRAKDKDGTPKREYYAIGYGGRVDGTIWDDTQTKEHFPEIAGVVAQHLAGENFYFAENSTKADLLIVIHWGRTIPFNDLNYDNQLNGLSQAATRLSLAEFRLKEVHGAVRYPTMAESSDALQQEANTAKPHWTTRSSP